MLDCQVEWCMMESMKDKIQIRFSEPEGYYYGYFGGKKYSIVDFGKVMQSVSDVVKKSGVFLGWESMEIKDNQLDTESIMRAANRDELIDMLQKLPLGFTAVLRDYNGFEMEMFFPSYMPKVSVALKHPTSYLKTGDFETTARNLSVEQRDFYFKGWIDEQSLVGLFTEI